MTDSAVLRTPDARFEDLADFPFEPNYVYIDDPDFGELRVHYLDEGPRDGHVVLLLHGQATWSYCYRHFIPLLTQAGYRVIAPDFIGFGRSDKLVDWEDYTFQKHVDWLDATLKALAIEGATGFLFDWGGFFGMRVAVERPEVFKRVILCTTMMPMGEGIIGPIWVYFWRRRVLNPPVFPISEMVSGMTDTELSADTLAGLEAPYPDESFKTGPRRFPMLIPASSKHPAAMPNRAAWAKMGSWEKPTLVVVSERLAKRAFPPKKLTEHVPGTAGQPHQTYPDTGFFLIEDAPEQLAEKIIAFAREGGD